MENRIKENHRSEKLAVNVQKAGVAAGYYQLIKAILFAAILIIMAWFIYHIGVPWYVSAVIIIVAVAIVVFQIVWLKRVSRVDVYQPAPASEKTAELEPGEVLVETIPAVMQYGTTRSIEIMGAGTVLTPENALLVTNRAVWALTVPLPGVDKVVSGADIGKWQWMNSYQDIIDGVQEMVSTLSLQEVLIQGRAKRLLGLNEIKSAKTLPFTYSIALTDIKGKKYRYSIRLEKDFIRAKAIFKIQ